MITVCTAAIPERALLLAEAVESVAAQSLLPAAHLIGVDVSREGPARTYNRLLDKVETEWVTFLDDDDLLLPVHLETLMANADDADVVYAGCECVGHHFANYNRPFDRRTLNRLSIVPITAAVRTSVIREAYGFADEWGYDWRMWQRLAGAGARFRSVPKITWVYRRLGMNQSHGEMPWLQPQNN